MSDSKRIFSVWETEEFLELADSYLGHEDDALRIADRGMERARAGFDCERIAAYMCDVIRTGTYSALWADGV